jgi:hypothetical protein
MSGPQAQPYLQPAKRGSGPEAERTRPPPANSGVAGVRELDPRLEANGSLEATLREVTASLQVHETKLATRLLIRELDRQRYKSTRTRSMTWIVALQAVLAAASAASAIAFRDELSGVLWQLVPVVLLSALSAIFGYASSVRLNREQHLELHGVEQLAHEYEDNASLHPREREVLRSAIDGPSK